jgi:16S rRNA (uracil1498-N3)-methyltransferase
MKKIRIYIEPNKINLFANNSNPDLTISFLHQQVKINDGDLGNVFSYLTQVMRQKIGDKIFIFDGVNGEFLSEIIAIEKKSLTLQIIQKTRDFKSSSNITLAFALLKSNRIDEIATKASELGVKNFQPLITNHCVVDKFNENRFFMNVKEACEQCERCDLANILKVKNLSDYLSQLQNSNNLLILADESRNSKKASEVFLSENFLKFKEDYRKQNQEIIVFIGPEGGFSKSEFLQFYNLKNLIAINLGERILRADTATIATLTLVQEFFS